MARTSMRASKRVSLLGMHGGYQPLPTSTPECTMEHPESEDEHALERRLQAATGSKQSSKALLYLRGLASEVKHSWRDHLQELIQSTKFQTGMVGLITINAVVIGLETDYPEKPYWSVVEHVFLVFFLLEVVLRFSVEGLHYVDPSHQDFWWNLFDVFVVTGGVLDVFVSCLSPSDAETGGEGSVSALRLVRLFRILRIFRLVRFLRELYLLAFSMVLASVAIFWVSVLMVFILYVCGIIVVRAVATIDEDDPNFGFITGKFGTIPKSMLTLFEFMVTPNLAEYQRILGEDYLLLTVFLMAFAIFGSFGLIALLSGVIHESMFEKNLVRMEENQITAQALRIKVLQLCGDLFDGICTEPTDTGLSYEAPILSVVELLPEICDLCEKLGVHFARKEDLPRVVFAMDLDASGSVSKHEFLQFLVHMVEGVQPLMLLELNCELVHYVKDRLDTIVDEVRQTQGNIRDSVAGQATQFHGVRKVVADLELQMVNICERAEQVTRSAATAAFANSSAGLEERLTTGLRQSLGEALAKASRELEASVTGAQRAMEAGLVATIKDSVATSLRCGRDASPGAMPGARSAALPPSGARSLRAGPLSPAGDRGGGSAAAGERCGDGSDSSPAPASSAEPEPRPEAASAQAVSAAAGGLERHCELAADAVPQLPEVDGRLTPPTPTLENVRFGSTDVRRTSPR